MGLPPLIVFQRLNSGMSIFSLLAIPFFIYSGDLMVRGGIAPEDRGLRGSTGGPHPRRAGTGQHRHRHAVRRHLGVGGRRSRCRRRTDDSADEGPRLRCRLCGQRHLDGGSDCPAPAAIAQHDHLFDLGWRQDFHRRPVHRRHHSGPALCRCPDGDRLFRGAQPRLSDRGVSGIPGGRALLPHFNPGPAAHRDHFRRRALRHIHRDGKLLHRRSLCPVRDRLRLPAD